MGKGKCERFDYSVISKRNSSCDGSLGLPCDRAEIINNQYPCLDLIWHAFMACA